ncbi:MAG: SagB/ThcOx family dehydrogenase [Elainellaceae cyanobacterium]
MANPQPSLAQYYHQQTKYHPDTLSQKAQPLDRDSQPEPFKDYKIGTAFPLKPYLAEDLDNADDVTQAWRRLSRLLLASYGLTVKIMTLSGEPVFFRASPSAGALYPAEIYLISRGTPVLPPGLYSYQSKTHALVHFWDSDVWTDLQHACFWHASLDGTQMALVTTAIFYRSAWRYQARAYRRIFLDTGHLLGNIELACAINRYRPHLIGGFADQAMDDLLYLNSEQEGTMTVMAIADQQDLQQNLPLMPTALASATQTDYPPLPDEDLLMALHQASRIPKQPDVSWKAVSRFDAVEAIADQPIREDKYNFPFCFKVATQSAAILWGEELLDLERTILKRRSTRQYSGADLKLDELCTLLDFTYQPHHYIDQGLERSPDYFDLELIETFVAVSGVMGLDEGCYYYAPRAQELRQIRFKNFRRELHFLCLGQELGRDAAALVFHTADLGKAVAKYGDRAYRYLHMDAGHLGQRMNLAAIRMGLGVSGIAGFFDDEVNEVLGIPTDEAVLYITTLGRPAR